MGFERALFRRCGRSDATDSCRARLSPEDAGDVVQAVFRAVAGKRVDFHHVSQGDTFRGWLYRITQNRVRDHFRRRAGSLEIAVDGTDAQLRFMQLEDDIGGLTPYR